MRQQVTTVLIALLLVASPISAAAPGVIGAASAQTGAPDGFVGVPDTNVQEDYPVGTNATIRASDLEGSVMASSNASSLQVVVTTPERASDYVNGTTVGGSAGGVVLVLQDDTNHAGRDVAVPADAIREATGGIPEVVHGIHEDGSGWSSEVKGRNGLLIFHVPQFSANTVTFDGSARIEARPAQNGSTYTYDAGTPSSVDNFNITATGSTATEWDNESGTALGDGSSLSLGIGGNANPSGPSTNGEPEVRFTGRETLFAGTAGGTGVSDGDSATFTVNGDAAPKNAEITFTGYSTNTSRTVSATNLADGQTFSYSNNGNVEATDASVTFIGDTTSAGASSTGTGNSSVSVGGNIEPTGESVSVTGRTSVTAGSDSATGLSPGDSLPLNIGGNVEPTGPSANNEPTVSVTSHVYTEGTASGWSLGTTQNRTYTDYRILNLTANQDGNYVRLSMTDYSGGETIPDTITIRDSSGMAVGSANLSGMSNSETPKDILIQADITSGSDYTVHAGNNGDEWTLNYLSSQSTSYSGGSVTVQGGQNKDTYYVFDSVTVESRPDSVTVQTSDGGSSSIGDMSDGQTVTREFNLQTSTSDVSVSADGGRFDVIANYSERTATENPSIDVDGDGTAEASWTGIYLDGESTTTKSVDGMAVTSDSSDASWLKDDFSTLETGMWNLRGDASYNSTGDYVQLAPDKVDHRGEAELLRTPQDNFVVEWDYYAQNGSSDPGADQMEMAWGGGYNVMIDNHQNADEGTEHKVEIYHKNGTLVKTLPIGKADIEDGQNYRVRTEVESGQVRVTFGGEYLGSHTFSNYNPDDATVLFVGDTGTYNYANEYRLDNVYYSDLSESIGTTTSMGPQPDWDLSWTERTATENPSIDVNGDGTTDATYSGTLSSGQTWSTSVSNLSPGSHTATVSLSAYQTDVDVDFTETTVTENPSVDVNGDSSADATYSGTLYQGQSATVSLANLQTGSVTADFTMEGSQADWTINYDRVEHTENPGVDLDGDGTPEAQHSGVLAPGETATAELSGLNYTHSSVVVQTASSTETDLTVLLEERTETVDPRVVVNGNTTGGATGRLADGEKAYLQTDPSWIQDGQNTVVVLVGSGTLSSDAPTPQVGLNYSHTAEVQVDGTYVSGGWAESYNVSHTYAGDREDPELRVPFSREIYRIENVEQRVNGGDWTTVPASSWVLQNGTDLTVHLDDNDGTTGVEAGDEIRVRTTGYKVQDVNGQITVTDPTDPTDTGLEAGIKVDSASDGFRLEVGGTANGDRVHYLHTESWDSPAERAVLDASGGQALYVPNAGAGDTARVTTIPLSVGISQGDVGIQVQDPDKPALGIGPGESGTGSEVQFTWHNVESGTTYGIYSTAANRYKDKSESGATSVTLTDDDSQEVLVIKQPDGSSGTSSEGSGGIGGVGGSGIWDDNAGSITVQEIAALAGWVGGVVLLIAATGRSSLEGRRRWITVGVISAGSGLLVLEVIRPGSVSGAINAGLTEVVPLAGLAAIGVAVYSVIQWWQARQKEASTPETQVVLSTEDN